MKNLSRQEKAKIGEQLLVARPDVIEAQDITIEFGTKPGWLDLALGEKYARRMVINGENIDPESEEYQQICETAYEVFTTRYQDKAEYEDTLREAEINYNALLKQAEENDKIKWPLLLNQCFIIS